MPERVWAEARVFIVDDEPSNVRILERLLGHDGYTNLVSFTDPRKVLPRLEADPPDLVLLDLLMPHVDGFEVLRRINESTPSRRPPVLVLTADATAPTRERALAAGALDFVTKPFDHLEVLLRVRNLLGRRALELDLVRQNQLLDERVRARTAELRGSLDRARRLSRERQVLLERLVGAQEQERARIAADIHDDTVQVMVAAGIRLELLARHLTDPVQRAEAERLQCTVADSLARLRTLLFNLRPPDLGQSGLAAALDGHLERARESGGPDGEVVNRLRQDPPPEVGALLFRIAQEALTNAHRHAHASRVWVILDEDDTGVQLTVRDDGRGFDPSRLLDPVPGHLGLVTMRERAAIAGGRFQLDAAPGAGTTITAWVPVQPEHRRDRAQWAG